MCNTTQISRPSVLHVNNNTNGTNSDNTNATSNANNSGNHNHSTNVYIHMYTHQIYIYICIAIAIAVDSPLLTGIVQLRMQTCIGNAGRSTRWAEAASSSMVASQSCMTSVGTRQQGQRGIHILIQAINIMNINNIVPIGHSNDKRYEFI